MRPILLFLALLLCAFAQAQKAEEAIGNLFKNYPQEKVILSYSKNEYIAGETIYFKAYTVSGYELSELSGNLYTELYDKNKILLNKQIVPLYKGAGQGSFILPSSLPEEVYYIRAYTLWMLNFDERFQYLQPINIYNPASQKKLQHKKGTWSAQAFIEGDKLLADVPAKITVRLSSQESIPTGWNGNLYESNNSTPIAVLKIINMELGQVEFIPKANSSYSIKIAEPSGKTQETPLPSVQTSGISIAVSVSEDKVNYTLQTKNISSNGTGYKIIGTIYDEMVFAATVKKSTGVITGSIDTKDFPSCVLQLSVFNEKEEPVLQRLCFLHPYPLKTAIPKIYSDTISFAPKGYNHWSVQVDSTNWASWAVEITDASFAENDHFLNDFYLRSDFPSSMQNGANYFLNENNRAAALDALMLTQKWERFNWNDILRKIFPAIQFKPDTYLSYVATATKGKKIQPLRDVNLILRTKDSAMQFVNVKTDTAGKFFLNNIAFLDTATVYFTPNKKKALERDIAISFDLQNKFYPLKGSLPVSEFETVDRKATDTLPLVVRQSIADKNTALLLNEKEKLMQEVVITTKARNATEELDRKLSSGLFSSINATVFDFVNQDQTSAMGYTNILQWLQGRVAGLTVGTQNGSLVPLIRGSTASLFIDEIRVEPDQLNSISIPDIAMIKVIRDNSLMGGGSGAIAIYTRRGDERSRSTTPGLAYNSLVGYTKQPSFFMPEYADGIGNNVADKRTILYRNALLYPADRSYTAPIRFYNNSSATGYKITVIGFDKEGSLIYMQKVITNQVPLPAK